MEAVELRQGQQRRRDHEGKERNRRQIPDQEIKQREKDQGRVDPLRVHAFSRHRQASRRRNVVSPTLNGLQCHSPLGG